MSGLSAGRERAGVVAVAVQRQLLGRNAVVEEGLKRELGRDEQRVGELVLALLLGEDLRAEYVCEWPRTGGRPSAVDLARDRIERVGRVGVRHLADRRDPELARRAQRLEAPAGQPWTTSICPASRRRIRAAFRSCSR